jgi:hypothetical protein
MRLEEVLPALRAGKNITRPKYRGWVHMGQTKIFLVLRNASGIFSSSEAMFDREDIIATDWEVVE